jgi:hypothetical protein
LSFNSQLDWVTAARSIVSSEVQFARLTLPPRVAADASCSHNDGAMSGLSAPALLDNEIVRKNATTVRSSFTGHHHDPNVWCMGSAFGRAAARVNRPKCPLCVMVIASKGFDLGGFGRVTR